MFFEKKQNRYCISKKKTNKKKKIFIIELNVIQKFFKKKLQ